MHSEKVRMQQPKKKKIENRNDDDEQVMEYMETFMRKATLD